VRRQMQPTRERQRFEAWGEFYDHSAVINTLYVVSGFSRT